MRGVGEGGKGGWGREGGVGEGGGAVFFHVAASDQDKMQLLCA